MSGGKIDVMSGGKIDVMSGGKIDVATPFTKGGGGGKLGMKSGKKGFTKENNTKHKKTFWMFCNFCFKKNDSKVSASRS
jgi:hypothetical protein